MLGDGECERVVGRVCVYVIAVLSQRPIVHDVFMYVYVVLTMVAPVFVCSKVVTLVLYSVV